MDKKKISLLVFPFFIFIILIVVLFVQKRFLSSPYTSLNTFMRAASQGTSFYDSFVENIGTPPSDLSYLRNGSYSIFVSNYHQDVPTSAVPLPNQIIGRGAELSSFATPGEYEPLTFSVYADKDLVDLTAGVGVRLERQDGDGVIGKQFMDLRMVKRLNMKIENTGIVENVGEYLDHIASINLAKNTVQQYWLTVKVPPNTPAGDYKGRLFVKAGNASRRAFDINFKVYPVSLEDNPARYYGIYYDVSKGDNFVHNGTSISFNEDQKWEILRSAYQDIKNHGATFTVRAHPPKVVGQGDQLTIDYSDFIRDVELKKELGLNKIIVAPDIFKVLQNRATGSVSPEDFYRQSVRQILAIVNELSPDSQLYFYPVDEAHLASDPTKEPLFKKLAPIIQQESGRVHLTSIPAFFDRPDIDPLVDLRNYNSRSESAGLDANLLSNQAWNDFFLPLSSRFDLIWTYYNCRRVGGRPEYYHVINGFWFWLKPFSSHVPWTYQWIKNTELFSDDPEKLGFAFAYPDPTNNWLPLLPSLRWEGYREGIDDYKYIYTLEQTLDQANANQVTANRITYAQSVLDNLRQDVLRSGPQANSLALEFNYDYYQSVRKNILEAIMVLQGLIDPPATRQCLQVFSQESGQGKSGLNQNWQAAPFTVPHDSFLNKISIKASPYSSGNRTAICQVAGPSGNLSSPVSASFSQESWIDFSFEGQSVPLTKNTSYTVKCRNQDAWSSAYWILDWTKGKTLRVETCSSAGSITTPPPTPVTGQCLSSCQTDADCRSGLVCAYRYSEDTSLSGRRCRHAACQDRTDCVCPW